MRRSTRSSFALFVASALSLPPLVSSTNSRAADVEQDRTMATDMFDRGVKRMAEGRCDDAHPTNAEACKEAIDLFRRAFALYPAALGALRNLAYCEKGAGLVASASRSFRELARRAPLDPKPERRLWADFARKEAEALELRVPHVLVKVPVERPKGMKLTLDGTALPEAAWGTLIEVDPGTHRVEATAPGKLPYSGELVVREREDKTATIAFTDAPIEAPVEKPKEKLPEYHDTTLPWVVAGAGGVAIGVGLGLGYASKIKRDGACGGTQLCDPSGLEDGRSLAKMSTIVTGVGATVLVGGIVWILATPSQSDASKKPAHATRIFPYASTDGAGFVALGAF